MVPQWTHLPIVLAVDVHGRAAAEGGVHRSRNDVRPPSVLDHILPELADGHARLHGNYAGIRIPLQYPVHPREVQANLLRIERSVPITAPRPPQPHRSTLFPRQLED